MTLTFDFVTLESCHVMPLGWSIPVPSLNSIKLTVPVVLKSQFLRFLGKRGSIFKVHLYNPKKALPWPERRIMTYCAWRCVQRCDLWAWRRNEKKDRNFHASNWLFAQTTHVDIAPWNLACRVILIWSYDWWDSRVIIRCHAKDISLQIMLHARNVPSY